MIQQGTEQAAPQPTPQAAPQPAPQQPHPAAPHEPTTLHDFTLNLLNDVDAREAFQLDPEGVLHACGLSDITAGDVHDLLPLVLDSVSTSHVVSAPTAITALVNDFSGLGDVSDTLDADILKDNEAISDLTDLVHHNHIVSQVTEVADVHHVTDSLVHNVDTTVIAHDVVDAHSLVQDVLIKDVVDVDVHDAVDATHNVAQVGDVHNDLGHNTVGNVVGDVKVGDIDVLDHIGNGNDLDVLHF